MTTGVQLLPDIKSVFGTAEKIATEDLLAGLIAMPEAPWATARKGDKPLDAKALADRLKGYGPRSKVVRIGTQTIRGYDSADFVDAWKRYLPEGTPSPDSHNNSRNIIDNKNNIVTSVTSGVPEAPNSDPAVCGEPADACRNLFTEERDGAIYELHATCIDPWNGVEDDAGADADLGDIPPCLDRRSNRSPAP